MRLFSIFGAIFKPFLAERDGMRSMSYLTILVCLVKFMLEGMTIHFFGSVLTVNVSDAMTYGAILTPVLGAHAARDWQSNKKSRVDNPDGGV